METWFPVTVIAATGLALIFAIVLASGSGDSRRRQRDAVRLVALERMVKQIMDHLDIAETEPHMPEVIVHLENRNKVRAAMSYHLSTGVKFSEAREAVRQIAIERGLQRRTFGTGSASDPR